MVVNWEAISAIANILMTLTAFIVIYISLKMNRREREYQRLREKMFFYSALKAGMESTHTDANHFFKYLQVNKEIQHKYPALVERDLYVYLEHIIPAAQSARARAQISLSLPDSARRSRNCHTVE